MKRKMRISTILFMCILLIGSFYSVSAAGYSDEMIADIPDIEQVAEEIIAYANDCCENEWPDEQKSVDDISFDEAYKVYVDVEPFQTEKMTAEELEILCADAPSVWAFPIHYSNMTAVVSVSKGLPLIDENDDTLTEEEKQEIRDHVGKWTPVSLEIDEDYIPMDDQIQKMLYLNGLDGETVQTILLGGIPGIHTLVTAVETGDQITGYASLETDVAVDSDKGEITLQQGTLYSQEQFKEVAAISSKVDMEVSDATSGAGSTTEVSKGKIFKAAMVLLVAFATACIFVRVRKA